ncbi:MAG: hypothetical protein IT236_18340 [Bacteroidia bacterium]|nr:hypothetical protein [Bacteroidia bacterium]
MNYKVVPFLALITRNENTTNVASQLEKLINEHSAQGWEYVRLEVVETEIAAEAGCFGFGAKPGFNTVFRMVVFRK